jgi:hypothetical protein
MAEKASMDRARVGGRMHIHQPRYMHREVTKLLKSKGMGPSEFFRSLYDQAKAAKLPIISDN